MQKRLIKLSKILSFMIVFGIISFTFTRITVAESNIGKVNWTKLDSPNSDSLYDSAINDQGIHIVVGQYGRIIRSIDGINWKDVKSNYKPSLVAVATNGSDFVVGGDDGLLFSTDGSKWDKISLEMPVIGKLITKSKILDIKKYYDFTVNANAKAKQDIVCQHVLWDGKQYIAVGYWTIDLPGIKGTNIAPMKAHETDLMLTSKNGKDWTLKVLDQPIINLVYNGSTYVGISGYNMVVSKDLKSWKLVYDNMSFCSLFVTNGKFFAIHREDSNSRYLKYIYTSSDGINWKKTKLNIDLDNTTYTFLWDGKQYIMAGSLDNIAVSKNLKSWEIVNSETEPFGTKSNAFDASIYSMKYQNGQLLAFGSNGFIGGINGSLDANNLSNSWSVLREGAYVSFSDLVYANNRYVAISGGYSGLWESNNGIDWEETKVTPNRTVERTLWSDLAVKDNIFIAVGHMPYADENTYYRSTEPGVWKEYKFPVSLNWKKITVSNNLFYYKGDQGYLTSKDGITWSKLKKVTNSVMMKTVTNGKITLGINFEERLYYSIDGKKWTKLKIPKAPNAKATDVHWDGKQFLVIGTGFDNNWFDDPFGFTAVSKDGLNWKSNAFYGYLFYTNLAWGEGTYVARPSGLIDENRMVSSVNGLDFTTYSNTSYYEMSKVIWDGSKFVAVGRNGVVLIGTLKK